MCVRVRSVIWLIVEIEITNHIPNHTTTIYKKNKGPRPKPQSKISAPYRIFWFGLGYLRG